MAPVVDIISGIVKLIQLIARRRKERLDLGLSRKEMRKRRKMIRKGELDLNAPISKEKDSMSFLTKIFDSTKNDGFSKKVAVLFITGTLLPTLSALGVNENIITMIGQLAGLYLGGQGIADAAHNFSSGKK